MGRSRSRTMPVLSGGTLAAAALAATLTSAGCAQILGGDTDYVLDPTGGGAGGTTSDPTGGAGGTGTGGTESTSSSTDGTGGTGTGGTGATACEGADLQTSSRHCGACDHDCLGGDCVAGVCQPRVLVEGLKSIQEIAIDDTHVYWLTAGDGSIERIAKSGAARELITTGQTTARALVIFPDDVYWIDPGAKKVLSAAKQPAAPVKTFKANVAQPRSLARAGQAILGTYGSLDGAVARWPTAGGPAVELATSLESPALVITAASTAHFVDLHAGSHDDELLRVPADGTSAPTVLATGLHEPRALAADAVFVYWADASGTVARAAADGEVTDITTGVDDARGVAVDDDHVYWTQIDSGEGALLRAEKNGADPVPLASGLVSPGTVLVDDVAIYWMDVGPTSGGAFSQGKIYVLAK